MTALTAIVPDVLVAGGGPAGAALATHLARRGRAVVLMEQSAAAHHKVCGEFLSHEAVTALDRLGIDLHRLGALPILGVRLSAQKEIAACDLSFPACSLTRRSLDESLLAVAAQAGATVLRGHRIDSLSPSGRTWTAQLSEGETYCAPAAFLAAGKHDVNGHRRPPGVQNDLVAFKMYYRLSPAQRCALHGWVELFLFPGGYAGLQLSGDHMANLCLLVNRRTLRARGNDWGSLMEHLCDSSPALAARLDGAEPLLSKPLALSSIPYGMQLARSKPGLWRLGDQAAVIPSFSGDGMAIALHSAQRAAGCFLAGKSSETYATTLARELHASIGFATTVARLLIAAPALAQAARLWPPLLKLVADRTRIFPYALAAQ